MIRVGPLGAYARALGGDVLPDGTITCPGPGHSKNDRSLSVHFTGDETFAVHSFAGDDWQLCKDHVRSLLGWRSFESDSEKRLAAAEANRQRAARHVERGQYGAAAQRLWDEAVGPRGTLVEEYLGARGIALPGHVCGRVIRFHPRCRFGASDDHHYAPAMIARYTPIAGDDDCKVTAIHRTELLGGDRHGVKKMLGSVAGQVIKLDADEDVTMGLALGEGIESTLAFSQVMQWRPVWAAGTRDVIAKFPVLSGIEALTVAVDHDVSKAGQEAAAAARDRWQTGKPGELGGTDFYWHMPRVLGQDFADLPKLVAAGARLADLVLSHG